MLPGYARRKKNRPSLFRGLIFDAFLEGLQVAKGLLIGGQNGGKIDQKADKKHAPNSDAFFDRFCLDFGGPGPSKSMQTVWEVLNKSRKSQV